MAEEGLFSNLKFTDIFFPAAASVASMYNPHIGRGLSTGMNLFNSLAAFQHDVKSFRQQQQEWDQMQDDRQKAIEAAGQYAGFVDKQVSEREEAARKAAVAQLDGDITFGTHGPEGPAIASVEEPLSAEDAKERFSEVVSQVAPQQFDVFGGTQLPGDDFQEQMAEVAAPRTSEALPWLVDERMQSELAGDADYKALLERQATAELMGGTMGLGPGSSIATLGNLAQGATKAQQERARMGQLVKDIELQRENEFIRSNLARDERQADALELQDKITAEKEERQMKWAAIATDIMGDGSDPSTLDPLEADAELRRMQEAFARNEAYFNPADPTSVRVREIAIQRMEILRMLAEKSTSGFNPPGQNDGIGTDTSTVDPDAARKAREAQERLRAIRGEG